MIATAANTQFALETITENFSKEAGIKTRLVISSSGKHTAQIIAGAPYDIFISADMKYPVLLHEQKLTTSSPKIYAYGKLVLWSIDTTRQLSIESLEDINIKHIAIPNPETAPYGQAALEVLQNLNYWELLKSKMVYGESVAQANQYIISGAAELGFTASSIVNSPINHKVGRWSEVPDTLYSPIAQGVVILKRTNKAEQAQKFYEYLLSEKSMAVLRSYGYQTE